MCAQRFSGYERRERNFYPTPEWVTLEVMQHLGNGTTGTPFGPIWLGRGVIWEPACGDGAMVRAMESLGHRVHASDIEPLCAGAYCQDFLEAPAPPVLLWGSVRAIISNPPYGVGGALAEAFIRKALELMAPSGGLVAMLLKDNFDSARRYDIFRDHPAWSKKLVLTERIVWFEPVPDPITGKTSGPSENHAWYIWDFEHRGPATLAYSPSAGSPARPKASKAGKPKKVETV